VALDVARVDESLRCRRARTVGHVRQAAFFLAAFWQTRAAAAGARLMALHCWQAAHLSHTDQ